MKIRHYALFSESFDTLLTTASWDILRNNSEHRAYYLPYTKAEYIKVVDVNRPSLIAETILLKAQKYGIHDVFSIGSGISALEYQLKKFSAMNVIVSDNNHSIKRIKNYNIFDDSLLLDALRDPLPVDEKSMVLFPRIDTEFEDIELKNLFKKCYVTGVDHICFLPAQMLTLWIVLNEIRVMLQAAIHLRKPTFCGYSRTRKSFITLFRDYYYIESEYENRMYFLRRNMK